ncbi:retropepsin-like aspartic protease [Prevotella sp. 10(H)]|uniref:retropepsin-like aspartic protease n=1 Tax=Prevotella sp. 10(H) TaxID=1158294 RepID=UPI0004A76138|nr:retropepsin-like aspartic protease [Prevotella sp. 10(H)]
MNIKNVPALIIVFLIGINLNAQKSDEKVGELLNKGDYIELNKIYSSVKEELSPPLKAIVDVVLNSSMNRPEMALENIDYLFQNFQQEIGFENVQGFFLRRCALLAQQGNYKQATADLEGFMNDVGQHMDKNMLNEFKSFHRLYNEMKDIAPTQLIRPDTDCEIPIRIDSLSVGGQMMYVPVTINGQESSFIFDTGCPGGFLLSERFAANINYRIIADSIPVHGVGTGYGKNILIDSMQVGNMVYRNVTGLVVPPNPAVDSVFQVDAVLGSGIMKAAGEFRIYPKERRIVFPIRQTPLPSTGSNIMLISEHPYVEAFSDGERLIMHFDIGNSSALLHYIYYQKHKEKIEKEGKKESKLSGGFGGVMTKDIYRLPVFPIKVGNKQAELKNLEVNIDAVYAKQGIEEGALGMGFITLFDKVVVNYSKMFVEVE